MVDIFILQRNARDNDFCNFYENGSAHLLAKFNFDNSEREILREEYEKKGIILSVWHLTI